MVSFELRISRESAILAGLYGEKIEFIVNRIICDRCGGNEGPVLHGIRSQISR